MKKSAAPGRKKKSNKKLTKSKKLSSVKALRARPVVSLHW